MLALRPNDFDREDRRDFAVLHLGKVIGHIYSGAGLHGGQWLYAIYGWGSDLADDLEDAKAKLKAQFEKLNSKPTQIANRKSSPRRRSPPAKLKNRGNQFFGRELAAMKNSKATPWD